MSKKKPGKGKTGKRKEQWDRIKQTLERVALALGFFMMFGIIILGQDFRTDMGNIVGVLFNPLAELVPFHIMLMIMASITGLYAALIQKYTMDWELMKNTQLRMKEFQKEYKEAQLSDNKYRMKKLEEERADMMEDQAEMSKMQFKPMAYIGIISIPLFMWAYLYISQTTVFVEFPFWGRTNLTDTLIGPLQVWILWYFLTSMPVSQMIRKALNIGM